MNDFQETFEVLDLNGQKTGEVKARTQVHAEGDWHRNIHLWIINGYSDILLQKR